ncbi:MAG TPA: TIGR03067 domain-containing protein [Isosphaeraceae bacterium]|nr:TIGR03067 domain-containing protein [Isosphaeraceae bacterium]
MRRLAFLLFAFLLAACGVNHAADEADDARAWQGTWKLVSCLANGESQTADMQWIVKGDHYNIRLDGKTGSDPYPFKLDTKQKRIDVHHHDTPKGTYGGHLKGIYEVSGNSLKVCYDLKGQRYPTSFDAGRGSAQVLYQFQRE